MARVPVPFYRWHIAWEYVWFTLGASIGIYLSWRMLWTWLAILAVPLLLFSLLVLWFSAKKLWRSRFPLAVRGSRKVSFLYEMETLIFRENGHKMRISFTSGDGAASLSVSSIRRWESPYEDEPISEAKREDVLDLACEELEDDGMTCRVFMSNALAVNLYCPRCGESISYNIPLSFGPVQETLHHLGDVVTWRPHKPVHQGGRPANGNLDDQSHIYCPHCKRDFYVTVRVKADRIESVHPDPSRKGWIPDNSVPIATDGVVTGHHVDPRDMDFKNWSPWPE